MGMAASSLRFAQLTARKNQVEFEGQQINQQRLVLSQKSSAIYNDMLTKQVPTAPDPSQFTKIVYKFNSGNGVSQILNLAKKASGPYNYNITYKKPATSTVLSRSKYQNVNFVKSISGNGYTANINGVSRQLSPMGEQSKKDAYEKALSVYNQMQQIENTRNAIIRSDKDSFDTTAFRQYAQEAGLTNKLFTKNADNTYAIDPDDELAVALFEAAGVKKQTVNGNEIGINDKGFDYSKIALDSELTGTPKNVQALIGVISGGSLVDKDKQATEISADNTNAIFEEIAKKLSGNNTSTAAEYKTSTLDPAFTAYQASCATPGIVNIGEAQALYSYKDDDGNDCYMYVPINDLGNSNSAYIDEVTVYENATTYLEGQTETEQQDANVILSDEGQISKITFADGTVVTPEVVTEMDQEAYDAAMVEYEYKKDVYEKEMNDANAKVKIIQAQDQKLEVRLKQLDTEQKALSTEIDAVKSVRDKSIESSFKTFG